MIEFIKAHAYGNDFLFVSHDSAAESEWAPLARRMCDRHFGLGADGLIAYRMTARGASMRLFNADGSAAEVSGNGVRCLASIVVDTRRARSAAAADGRAVTPDVSTIVIETEAGLKPLALVGSDRRRYTFRAAMGHPKDVRRLDLEAADVHLGVIGLSVGNPQCMLLGPPVDEAWMRRVGPALEHHPAFPNRTNVGFVHVEGPDRLRMLIWERGVGPTLASGTGACAAAVAAALYGEASRTVTVASPGGSQLVEWNGEGLFLTGWAELLCRGEWVGDANPL
jgi:diaminopimelate epimerase